MQSLAKDQNVSNVLQKSFPAGFNNVRQFQSSTAFLRKIIILPAVGTSLSARASQWFSRVLGSKQVGGGVAALISLQAKG